MIAKIRLHLNNIISNNLNQKKAIIIEVLMGFNYNKPNFRKILQQLIPMMQNNNIRQKSNSHSRCQRQEEVSLKGNHQDCL